MNAVILVFRINVQNYQLLLAMLFAINEINWNLHILPNTSLGLKIYNLPLYGRDVMKTVFYWLTGLNTFIPNYNCREEKKSAGVLTGISWKTSENIGRVLNLYKFPQVSNTYVSNVLPSLRF